MTSTRLRLVSLGWIVSVALFLATSVAFAQKKDRPKPSVEDISRAVVKVISKGLPGDPALVSSGLLIRYGAIDPGDPPFSDLVLTTAHGIHQSIAFAKITITKEQGLEFPCELISWRFETDLALLHCPYTPVGARPLDFIDFYSGTDVSYIHEGKIVFPLNGFIMGYTADSATLVTKTVTPDKGKIIVEAQAAERIHPGLERQGIIEGIEVTAGMSGGILVLNEGVIQRGQWEVPWREQVFFGFVSKRLDEKNPGEGRTGVILAHDAMAHLLASVRFGRWRNKGPSLGFGSQAEQITVEQDLSEKNEHPLNVRVEGIGFSMSKELVDGRERRVIKLSPPEDLLTREITGQQYRSGSYHFGQWTLRQAMKARPDCAYEVIGRVSRESGYAVEEISDYSSALSNFVDQRMRQEHPLKATPMLVRVQCPDREQILAKIQTQLKDYDLIREKTGRACREWACRTLHGFDLRRKQIQTELAPLRKGQDPASVQTWKPLVRAQLAPYEILNDEEEALMNRLEKLLHEVRAHMQNLYVLIDER